MRYKDFKITKESVDKLFPKENINILDYKPPIEIFLGQMRMEQENGIVKAIQQQGVNVDKDELNKALAYDRDQYEKGYVNGYYAGLTADKWISVEDRLPPLDYYDFVLVWDSWQKCVCIGHYSHREGRWEQEPTLKPFQNKITHWSPFPEAPKEYTEECE